MSVTSVTFQTMADSNQEEENEEDFAIHGNDDTRGQKKNCLEQIVLMIFPLEMLLSLVPKAGGRISPGHVFS